MLKSSCKNSQTSIYLQKNGPVVQLNRTSDSGSESRGFESLRGHMQKPVVTDWLSCFMANAHTQNNNYNS